MQHNTYPDYSEIIDVQGPTLVKIGELTIRELYQPSGIIDEKGREITNLDAIRLVEEAGGAQDVFINMNGQLSAEARTYNSELTRQQSKGMQRAYGSELIVAVMTRRPPAETKSENRIP